MLESLHIKDFVIINDYKINFGTGLNIITGETGSGKSLIFKAINLLLGSRATSELVRPGRSKAILEARFIISNFNEIKSQLADPDFYDLDREIVIRKEITASGKSRAFLNSSQISVNELKSIRNVLLDYHGQNSTSRITEESYQLTLIDAYGQIDKTNYIVKFRELQSKLEELDDFREKQKIAQEKFDFWCFKLKEFEAIDPKENEFEKLREELKLLENAEVIFADAERSASLLASTDTAAEFQIAEAIELFRSLSKYDRSFEEFIKDLKSAMISVREAGKFANDYKSNSDFEPWTLDQKRSRFATLKNLVKKYGDFNQIIKDKEVLKKNIENFDSADFFEEQIKKDIAKIESDLLEYGLDIRNKRKLTASIFTQKINSEFESLGLDNGEIDVLFDNPLIGIKLNSETKASMNGLDLIKFQFKANKGGKFSDLKNSASSGELSRIMLASKKTMKDKDSTELLVFDEIDTGISGRISSLVGKYIKSISSEVQIIAITHQPQLAAVSDSHFQVYKTDTSEGTVSSAVRISDDKKIEQVAKLFSGDNLSQESLASAKQLMEN